MEVDNIDYEMDEEITEEDSWTVISSYFEEKGLVRQQLDSFDYFMATTMQVSFLLLIHMRDESVGLVVLVGECGRMYFVISRWKTQVWIAKLLFLLVLDLLGTRGSITGYCVDT